VGLVPAPAHAAWRGSGEVDPAALAPVAVLLGVAAVGWLGWRYAARGERGSRAAEAAALMAELKRRDAAWDPEAFKARVRTVFEGVFPISAPGDVERVASLVTPAYRARLAERLVTLHKQGRRRRPDRASIEAIEVVHVDDRLDDTQDRAWAFIRFFGDEVVIDQATGLAVEAGSNTSMLGHQQLWKFVRHGDTWLLDDIELNAARGVFEARAQSERQDPTP
jgi:predicted lipid-binding transport protein (Tim44 family)